MEKEEQAAAQVQGKGDCGSLGGGLASYYYDPSSSLAELNRLYNVSHHLPPTALPHHLPPTTLAPSGLLRLPACCISVRRMSCAAAPCPCPSRSRPVAGRRLAVAAHRRTVRRPYRPAIRRATRAATRSRASGGSGRPR